MSDPAYLSFTVYNETLSFDALEAELGAVLRDQLGSNYDSHVSYSWENERFLKFSGYASPESGTAFRVAGSKLITKFPGTTKVITRLEVGGDTEATVSTADGATRYVDLLVPFDIHQQLRDIRALHTAGDLDAMIEATLRLADVVAEGPVV
ncbi:hypothetical protein ACFVAJ_17530 [Agromyces sp. NPDC057679]|uniref:hypothetical protein n=1 Tax=Agromyces sp. NPDC057679 TaxID=3346207 RepID=UPI00366AD7EE